MSSHLGHKVIYMQSKEPYFARGTIFPHFTIMVTKVLKQIWVISLKLLVKKFWLKMYLNCFGLEKEMCFCGN